MRIAKIWRIIVIKLERYRSYFLSRRLTEEYRNRFMHIKPCPYVIVTWQNSDFSYSRNQASDFCYGRNRNWAETLIFSFRKYRNQNCAETTNMSYGNTQ